MTFSAASARAASDLRCVTFVTAIAGAWRLDVLRAVAQEATPPPTRISPMYESLIWNLASESKDNDPVRSQPTSLHASVAQPTAVTATKTLRSERSKRLFAR